MSTLLGFSFRALSIFQFSTLEKIVDNPELNYYLVLIIDTVRSNSKRTIYLIKSSSNNFLKTCEVEAAIFNILNIH